MSKFAECNAIVDDIRVSLDRDIFLSVWVMLDYGGTHQGFGGYVLGGTPDCAAGKHRAQGNLAAEFLVRVMLAAGVDDLMKAKGKTVRVRREPGFNGSVKEIGHIVKDDKWFNPEETFKSWEGDKQ